ncbi:MAG: hypothetical protein JXA94_05300 [Parachlamydiales bacterium]|nr:hypothetical protein [Parachlamydiales bacterium]
MSTLTYAGISLFPAMKINDLATTEKAINAADFITQATKKAFEDFLERKYENFDALVGENACQLRVSMVLDLTRDYEDLEILKIISRISQVQQRILSLNKSDLIPTNEMGFEKFLEINNIFIEIPSKYQFLIEAYILSKSKDDKKFERTKPENLQKLSTKISKKLSQEIVKEAQRALSRKSVEYLEKIAQDNNYPLSDELIYVDKKEVRGLPCFMGIELLLKHFSNKKYPILLKCKSISDSQVKSILFTYQGEAYDIGNLGIRPNIKLKEFLKQILLKPVFVVEGFCDKKVDVQKIKELGVESILKANAAAHFQYFSDGKLLNPFDTEGEDHKRIKDDFHRYKDIALKEGYSNENPSVFCVKHIICKTLLNALKDNL